MRLLAGARWTGGIKWKWGGRKWWFSLLLFIVFRIFYIHGHTTAYKWCNCRGPWQYFTSNFSKTMPDSAKVTI